MVGLGSTTLLSIGRPKPRFRWSHARSTELPATKTAMDRNGTVFGTDWNDG